MSPLSGIVNVPAHLRPAHQQRDTARSPSQRRALLVNGNEGSKIHEHPLCTLHATVRGSHHQAISLKSMTVQIHGQDELRSHPGTHEHMRWKVTAPPRLIVGRTRRRRLEEKPGEQGWLGAGRTTNAEFVESTAERARGKTELFRGSSRTFDAPIQQGERMENMVTFLILQSTSRIRSHGRGRTHHERIEREQPVLTEDQSPLHDVLQLPDIPRPSVPDQALHRGGVEVFAGTLQSLRMHLQKMPGEDRNIFGTLS